MAYDQTSYIRGLIQMQKEPTAALRRRRRSLLRQLPPLKAILRGSLIERYKRCGKPGCKCADGPGHGPKYYLSVSYPGLRPQMDYVPQESYGQTAEFLANYHCVQAVISPLLTSGWNVPLGRSVRFKREKCGCWTPNH